MPFIPLTPVTHNGDLLVNTEAIAAMRAANEEDKKAYPEGGSFIMWGDGGHVCVKESLATVLEKLNYAISDPCCETSCCCDCPVTDELEADCRISEERAEWYRKKYQEEVTKREKAEYAAKVYEAASKSANEQAAASAIKNARLEAEARTNSTLHAEALRKIEDLERRLSEVKKAVEDKKADPWAGTAHQRPGHEFYNPGAQGYGWNIYAGNPYGKGITG